MNRQLIPSGHDIRPRSWPRIHQSYVDHRERDPEAWRDGLRAGLNLWKAHENGDPMADTMRRAIELEEE